MAFGLIAEDEHQEKLARGLDSENVQIRLLTIPGADNHCYLAFLNVFNALECRIRSGDSLKVNFKPDVNDGAEA
ncbi:hypothetical protein GX50_06816 [[Emmonsia] crescens]|uniref:Uncharacterized protein n=1 Tax=[Emmonsia] crescens TaxID=73230 RepID=A0A2B7ZAK9_9EURO|nr:hypothetical protein GX50_06816 [Emmonsia crescens]